MPTKPTQFRLSDVTHAQLKALNARLNVSRAAIVTLAINKMAIEQFGVDDVLRMAAKVPRRKPGPVPASAPPPVKLKAPKRKGGK